MGPLTMAGPGVLACIDRVISSLGLVRNVNRLGSGRHSASAKRGRGGRANSTTASVTVEAIPLPARMIQGTPAHRHESTSRRIAAKVSVSESAATPGSSR